MMCNVMYSVAGAVYMSCSVQCSVGLLLRLRYGLALLLARLKSHIKSSQGIRSARLISPSKTAVFPNFNSFPIITL